MLRNIICEGKSCQNLDIILIRFNFIENKLKEKQKCLN